LLAINQLKIYFQTIWNNKEDFILVFNKTTSFYKKTKKLIKITIFKEYFISKLFLNQETNKEEYKINIMKKEDLSNI
jgi:hypothetical protein